MKKFFLLMMLFCSFTSIKVFAAITDTVKQAHVIDGTLNEWAADSFTADKETEISYAVDNDAHQLYIALKITNQRTQFRLMRLGMNVFIDIKGKHKEGTSIEFPLKNSPLDAANQGGGGFGGQVTGKSVRASESRIRLRRSGLPGGRSGRPPHRGSRREPRRRYRPSRRSRG